MKRKSLYKITINNGDFRINCCSKLLVINSEQKKNCHRQGVKWGRVWLFRCVQWTPTQTSEISMIDVVRHYLQKITARRGFPESFFSAQPKISASTSGFNEKNIKSTHVIRSRVKRSCYNFKRRPRARPRLLRDTPHVSLPNMLLQLLEYADGFYPTPEHS